MRGEHSVKHAQTQEWLLKRTGRKILKNARISFYPKSCDLKLHETFRDPLISPSGRKVCGVEKGEKEEEKIPLALMGVLAPGSAHARPSAQPPIAHVRVGLLIRTRRKTLLKSPPWGLGEVPIFVLPQISKFHIPIAKLSFNW